MSLSHLMETPAKKHWEKVGVFHHHGFALPLFSLKTDKSSGIGEYLDLIPLLDWCHHLGCDIIQLLPLNDTGYGTSPYNAISAFALNPWHISLHQLPYVEECYDSKHLLESLKKLNNTPRIDYKSVFKLKETFIRTYYSNIFTRFKEDPSYQKFLSNHEYWLPSFALFKTLRKKNRGAEWEKWPEEEKKTTIDTLLKGLTTEQQQNYEYECFLQFLCFSQLAQVKNYASQKNILLFGDIPILISRDSADVWAHRSNFLLDYAAGSPPDMYNPKGQNWGFPVYDWNNQKEENYIWWKKRLEVASLLYDLYRIDHVVGFYRIWSIPRGMPDNNGLFLPEDENLWVPQGENLMKMMLESSSMLPIGEDLGVVPPKVRVNLRKLGICGTKVMRWERKWEADKSFIPPKDYIPESLTCVSTHDSETLKLWWKNQKKEAKDFAAFKGWDFTSKLQRQNHQQMLYDSHHTNSLFHINLLNEYLALVPNMTHQDPRGERINTPGTRSKKNWTYRFVSNLEEIVENQELKDLFRIILANK